MPTPLRLDPDRLFPADPRSRPTARDLASTFARRACRLDRA